MLQEESLWADVDLTVIAYKDFRDVFILGGIEDVVAKLDDSLVVMNTILGSRFVGPIRDLVDSVHNRLLLLQVCVV
jgi:dynein heavy chain, axonemal